MRDDEYRIEVRKRYHGHEHGYAWDWRVMRVTGPHMRAEKVAEYISYDGEDKYSVVNTARAMRTRREAIAQAEEAMYDYRLMTWEVALTDF